MKNQLMRVISNIFLTIAVILSLVVAFMSTAFIEGVGQINDNNRSSFLVLLTVVIVLIVAIIILVVASHQLKNKYRKGSLGELIHEDTLSIEGGWLVSSTQALQFKSIIFNSSHSNINFIGDDNEVIVSLSFNDITKIRMNGNLRSPIFSITTATEKYTVAFVKALDDIKAFIGLASTIKVIALGGAGTALSGVSAVESSYGQILNDRLEMIHGWLRVHHVKAYKQAISRNLIILFVFLGLIILVFVLLGLFAKTHY